jgi:hypothetical protein
MSAFLKTSFEIILFTWYLKAMVIKSYSCNESKHTRVKWLVEFLEIQK